MAENLARDSRIQTLSDLMQALEDEIGAVKTGDLKEKQAAHVLRGRSLQIRVLDIGVQAARLETKVRGPLFQRMGLLNEPDKTINVKATKQ